MREITRYVLIFYSSILSTEKTALGDQLGADEWDNLQEKLLTCYPNDGKPCEICTQLRKTQQEVFLSLMDIKHLNEYKVSPVDDANWGECDNGKSKCIYGGGLGLEIHGDLSRFVGKATVEDLGYGCNCKGTGEYGPFCNWNEPEIDNREFCGFGKYNTENFLSACECRDETTNKAIPYHGWYCNIHNRLLCDARDSTRGKFYDVNVMDTDKVADCCSKVCKDCDKIIKNCGECKQDEENNWELECISCKNKYNDLNNNCRNECDIDNNDGCNNETEICKDEVLEENEESFSYTYCECIIPTLDLADDGSCQYKKTECNDGTTKDCYGNGKCIQLPGQDEKSCLCKITHAGQFCENKRTCDSVESFDSQKLCLNNGTCEVTNDQLDYKCKCEPGFHGKNCENVHPCHPLKVKSHCAPSQDCDQLQGADYECINKI